jgi:hypothetical protein
MGVRLLLVLFAIGALGFSACQFPECWSFDNSALTNELQRKAEREMHCARDALTVQPLQLGHEITHVASGCGLQARYTCRWNRDMKQCRVDEAKCQLVGCGRSKFITTETDMSPACPAPGE